MIRSDLRPLDRPVRQPDTESGTEGRTESSAGRATGHNTDPGATTSGGGLLRSFVGEAVSGIKWLVRRPELRGIMILATIINLGLNSAVTSVIFGLQQQGGTPAEIGMVSAGIGVGMLLGSLIAAPWSGGSVRAGSSSRGCS